jgi:hypothetical protein
MLMAQNLPISVSQGAARLDAFVEERGADCDITSLLSTIERRFDIGIGVERDIDAVVVCRGGWYGYRRGDDCRDKNGDD